MIVKANESNLNVEFARWETTCNTSHPYHTIDLMERDTHNDRVIAIGVPRDGSLTPRRLGVDAGLGSKTNRYKLFIIPHDNGSRPCCAMNNSPITVFDFSPWSDSSQDYNFFYRIIPKAIQIDRSKSSSFYLTSLRYGKVGNDEEGAYNANQYGEFSYRVDRFDLSSLTRDDG